MTRDDPATPDPRDRRDDGLQDARDDSATDCTCQQVGEVEDANCPRHGIVSFLGALFDARQAERDAEDARDDSDPGECPAGGDHVWTDAVGPEHEHLRPEHRWHCDECGASPPNPDSDPGPFDFLEGLPAWQRHVAEMVHEYGPDSLSIEMPPERQAVSLSFEDEARALLALPPSWRDRYDSDPYGDDR